MPLRPEATPVAHIVFPPRLDLHINQDLTDVVCSALLSATPLGETTPGFSSHIAVVDSHRLFVKVAIPRTRKFLLSYSREFYAQLFLEEVPLLGNGGP